MGSARGIRFIGTTQAQSFKGAGASSTDVVNVGGSADVYPVIIMAQDFGGCATLGGKDSIKSKVVAPKPGPGDPLGQRGTVAWETFTLYHSSRICICTASSAVHLQSN